MAKAKPALPHTCEVMADGKLHVARMTPEGVYLREKGKRTEYGPVSWGLILLKGAQSEADASRKERHFTRRVSRSLLST